jgi:hypothetical protein
VKLRFTRLHQASLGQEQVGYARFVSGGWYGLSFCGHRTRIDQLPAISLATRFLPHFTLSVLSSKCIL